jgi:hypothetical protein
MRFLSIILALLFPVSITLAQNTTLQGQVVDQLGAVIPNARITNRVNYGQLGGVMGSAYFGIPSGSGPARQMDFSVRVSF